MEKRPGGIVPLPTQSNHEKCPYGVKKLLCTMGGNYSRDTTGVQSKKPAKKSLLNKNTSLGTQKISTGLGRRRTERRCVAEAYELRREKNLHQLSQHRKARSGEKGKNPPAEQKAAAWKKKSASRGSPNCEGTGRQLRRRRQQEHTLV